MMKKLLLLLLICTAAQVMGQSLEEAKKFHYYDRLTSAAEVLEKLIKNDPGNTAAYYWLSQTRLQMGDTIEARQAIQAVTQLQQDDPKLKADPLTDAGIVHLLMLEEKKAEAMATSDRVVKETKGKNAEVLRALARAQIDAKQGEGNYDYALELLESALKRDKKNPENYMLMGDAWRRKGDGGNAVSHYSRAIELDAGYARANYSIAKIYVTQQNYSVYLKHFLDAIQQDPAFAPAYYELYYHFYFRDVNEAKNYLEKYIANTDQTVENDYMMTDLLYVSSKNQEAIDLANKLLQQQGEKARPRLFKLISYSYDAMGDSIKALTYINTYFDKEKPGNYVAKDYALKAELLMKTNNTSQQQAVDLWEKAVALDTLEANKIEYMQHMASVYKNMKDRSKEAYWLGEIFETKEDPSNLDIYYWGLAHYAAGEYRESDSVFGLYINKYPEQVHGYLWRAKSNAFIDSTMEKGLAVPYYTKVIEIADDDKTTNKTLLIQAYGYIGAYEANVEKDYPVALDHFQKILELDPANNEAARYSEILKKWIDAADTTTTGSTAETNPGKGGK